VYDVCKGERVEEKKQAVEVQSDECTHSVECVKKGTREQKIQQQEV
jgi:hypothetical protein